MNHNNQPIKLLIPLLLFLSFQVLNIHLAKAQTSGFENPNNPDNIHDVIISDSIIDIYKLALKSDKNNVDLRNKMGLYYFSQQNFRRAAKEFEHNLSIDPGNGLAIKYHYWSTLNSGFTSDARKVLRKMNPYQLTETEQKKPSFFQQVDLGSGIILSNNREKNADALTRNADTIFASQTLDGNMFYNYTGLKINPFGWLSLYFGYQSLVIQKYHQELIIDYITTDSIFQYTWNDTAYYRQIFSESPVLLSKKYNLIQNQYYINAEINPGKGWNIVPAFHYLKFKHTPFYVEYKYKEYQALPFDTANTILPRYTIINDTTTFDEWAGGVTIYKDLGNFKLSGYVLSSNIAHSKKTQNGYSVTWFPFGNLNLYASARFDFLKDRSDKRSVYGFGLGGKLLDNLWADAGFIGGNMQSFADQNVYIVYNSINQSVYKINTTLTWILGRHFDVQVRYNYSKMKAEQKIYPTNEEQGSIQSPNIYNLYQTHSLILGISWKI